MREPTPQQFLRDVASHSLSIKLDQGIYRHLRFAQPRNSNMWFDLVTWPGVLTIHGDMGTWTFSRVQDMFTFFRSSPGKFEINPDYWAEKLQHGVHGGTDGAKVWDDDLFREQLLAQLADHYGFEGSELAEIGVAVREEVLCQDNKYDLLIAARDFKHGEFHFNSCELPSGKTYAYQFIWCLYAIVWGIHQFDVATEAAKAGEILIGNP